MRVAGATTQNVKSTDGSTGTSIKIRAAAACPPQLRMPPKKQTNNAAQQTGSGALVGVKGSLPLITAFFANEAVK